MPDFVIDDVALSPDNSSASGSKRESIGESWRDCSTHCDESVPSAFNAPPDGELRATRTASFLGINRGSFAGENKERRLKGVLSIVAITQDAPARLER